MRRYARYAVLLFLLALTLAACNTVTVTTNPQGDVVVTVCSYFGAPVAGIEVALGGTVLTTGADGTVTFEKNKVTTPYDLAIFDRDNNEAFVFLGLDTTDVGLILPSRMDLPTGGSATVTGNIANSFAGSNSGLQVVGHAGGFLSGAVTNDAGESASYAIAFDWKTTAALDATLYGLDIDYAAAVGKTPGDPQDYRMAVETFSIADGDALTQDSELWDVPLGTLSGSATLPAGYSADEFAAVAVAGVANTNVNVPFGLFSDDAPGTSFSFATYEMAPPWNVSYAVALRALDADGRRSSSSRTGLAFNASGVSLDLQDSIVEPVAENSTTFAVGDTITLQSAGNGTNGLVLEPVQAGDLKVTIFTTLAEVAVPSLGEFGVDFVPGAAYVMSLFWWSWPLELMASKAADPGVLLEGVSIGSDLDSIRSLGVDLTVEDTSSPPPPPPGGKTPPATKTNLSLPGPRGEFPEALISIFFPPLPQGQPQLQAGSSCPAVLVAATDTSLVVNACDVSLLQEYPFQGTAFFDSLLLPVPAGQTGDAGLFQAGTSYALTPIDASGAPGPFSQINPPGSGPFVDSNIIGSDPSNGAVTIDAAFNRIFFIRFDALSEIFTFDGTTVDSSTFPSGFGVQSAATNDSGDKLLVIGDDFIGGAGKLLLVDLSGGMSAQATATEIGTLGSNPRRIRCDLTSGFCAASDFADSSVTIIAWDGASNASITATVSTTADGLADGPVGVDVFGNRVVSAGFNDANFSVISLASDGSVDSVVTDSMPSGCLAPGHAIFLEDANNTVLASCNGSGSIAYLPGAF